MRKISKRNAKIIALASALLMIIASLNNFLGFGLFPGYAIEIAFFVNVAGLIVASFIAPILGHKFIGVRDHEIDRDKEVSE